MVIAGMHKNVSLLVLVFLALHIVTAVADGFAPIHWISAVIPFTSPYRPLWLGLGALAVDLLIALVVTSLLRSRLSLSTWRLVHWSAYACWPIAFVHGLGTGSDGRVGWVQVLDIVCLTAVVAAIVWRLATGWQRDPARRVAASLAMSIMVFALVGWAAAGPTRAGWARRAGTPSNLLASGTTTPGRGEATDPAAAPGTDPGSTTAPAATLTVPFTATLSGTLAQSDTGGGGTRVTIDATLSGTQPGVLHVEIDGTGTSDGGVRMSSSTVTVGTPSNPDQYQGTIVRLRDTDLTIQMTDGSGTPSTLAVRLQIDDAAGTVTGTATAAAGAVPRSGEGDDN